MKRRISFLLLICAVFMASCAKQTPDQAPGTAAITNIKTGLNIAALAIVATQAALPAFKLDPEDLATANEVLSEIAAARDIFATKIAPYTSFDSSNSEEIKRAARDGLATLQALHDSRVDHIKNPTARARVDAALQAVQLALNIVLGQVGT